MSKTGQPSDAIKAQAKLHLRRFPSQSFQMQWSHGGETTKHIRDRPESSQVWEDRHS